MKYVIAFVFCMFMGVFAISLGGGTAYPPLNQVAQPLLCPGGKMTSETTASASKLHKKKTIVQTAWTCEQPSGAKTPIPMMTVALYNGGIFGFGLFLLLVPLLALGSRKGKSAS